MPREIKQAGPGFAIILALIPVFDALINQIGTLVSLTIGSLSLFQIARGSLLGIVLLIGIWLVSKRDLVNRRVFRLFGIAIAMICAMSVGEWTKYRGVSFGTIIFSIQIVFWMLLWLVASQIIKTPRNGRIVLLGIAVSSLISALGVLYFFAQGNRATAAYGDVFATSGLFFSAKYLIGSWIVGGFAWLYLTQRRYQIIGFTAAASCFLALFVTYNRTGQVCLLVSTVYVIWWRARQKGNDSTYGWVNVLIIAVTVAVMAFLASVDTSDLTTRWGDLNDRDTAGSGRILLWSIATLWFIGASWQEIWMGVGLRGMHDAIEVVTGLRIHTHSDFFDLLMSAGIFGVIFYFALIRTIFKALMTVPYSRDYFVLASTVALTLSLSGLLTGQVSQPSAMVTYVLALTAVNGLAKEAE